MYPFIETIRIEDGQIYNLDYHTERFNETRAAFWKDSTPLDLREFISPPTLNGIHKCRIVYGKEVEEVTYAPYQMRQVSSLHLVVSDTIDYTYKSAHREELNALYAQKGMADDILIVRNGYLTDTSIANVALYDGDTWFTPAHPLLRGTKRSEFLDRQLIVEKDIPQICLHYRIIAAISEQIGVIQAVCGNFTVLRCVSVDEPMCYRVVISALEVIEPCLGVVVVPTVAQRVDFCLGAGA